MTGIIVDGREVACDAPVRTWHDHGLHFASLGKRSQTTAVVLHHTGGDGLAPQVYRTLLERQLSVHIVVEPNGTISQLADASMRCAHAGTLDMLPGDAGRVSGNATTIGIEIVNAASSTERPGRPMVDETIHGLRKRATGFTDAQNVSVAALCRALCGAYGLPNRVPIGDGSTVLSTVMGGREFAAFRGVLGHFHLTRRKRDCGLAIFEHIMPQTLGRGTPRQCVP